MTALETFLLTEDGKQMATRTEKLLAAAFANLNQLCHLKHEEDSILKLYKGYRIVPRYPVWAPFSFSSSNNFG
jgi:hypothetical protein